jgi:hypothetical protein
LISAKGATGFTQYISKYASKPTASAAPEYLRKRLAETTATSQTAEHFRKNIVRSLPTGTKGILKALVG